MGLFFKKIKKFGLLKLNFSKSGIGLSLGVKGFRISKNSKGTQLNIGRNGLYYRKSLNGNNNETPENLNSEAENGMPKNIITIYQTPEVQQFSGILFTQIILTLAIVLALFSIKAFMFGMLILFIGGVIIFNFIKKHPNEYNTFIEQGQKINELKKQNYKILIKQGNANTQNEDAIERRNKSKYQNYKYSYENYKKD